MWARRTTSVILWIGVVGTIGFGLAVVPVGVASARTAPVRSPSADAVATPSLPWGHPVTLGANPDFDRPAPHPGQIPHVAGGQFADLTSSNWAGVVDSGATYTGVSASWTVPTLQTSPSSGVSSTWIGIDGYSNTSLIQTGTAQNISDGVTQYFAWYEILPAAPVLIGGVNPGDNISADVFEDSPGTWTITIEDTTLDAIFSEEFAYDGPGSSAEWIEEMQMETPQPPLANFGTAQFTTLEFSSSDPGDAVSNLVVMLNADNDVLAYPSSVANDDLGITYGPFASQTSIAASPNSVTSGTSVTYSASVSSPYGGTPIGTVTFNAGPTPLCTATLSNGSASCSSSAAPDGSDTISGTYLGDNIYAASTGSTILTVNSPAPAPPPQHGYWLVGADGGIFSFGSAQFYGSTGNLHLQRPVVGIVPTKDRGGYWLDASDGGVFSFGDTQFYGSIPGLGIHPAGSGLPNSLNAPIVGMVPSHDQGGYFMVASDGGVFAFGDAHFAGSCPGIGGCSGAAVAVMPDASGNGYWLITQTGNVYTFGDAPYLGAPGPQSSPITSAVATPSGHGYYILDAAGQVFAYGDANDGLGNVPPGATGGSNPASAIFVTSDNGGYWVADALGKVFPFGNAPSDGDMSGTVLNAPIIAASGS
jgi:hypothetical protein